MAAETANYGLKKPGAEDFYNIEDFNWNADVIDAELAKRAELGEDGKVPAAQLPAMDFDPAGSAAAVQTALPEGHWFLKDGLQGEGRMAHETEAESCIRRCTAGPDGNAIVVPGLSFLCLERG